jgi:transcriptional regulator with XRE-family HTH domain
MNSPQDGVCSSRQTTRSLRITGGDYSSDVSKLCQRVEQVRGDRTVQQISRETGVSSETVRRYLTGKRPSADFLVALCSSQDISALWLLTGEGPMRQSQVTNYYLSTVGEVELCSELGRRIQNHNQNAFWD